MYELVWQGQDTGPVQVPELLVSGAHDPVDVPADAVTLDRVEELVQVAGQRWRDLFDVDAEALNRVVAEALESSLLTGLTPQTWSPLSRLGAGQVGQMTAEQRTVDALAELVGVPDGLSLARLTPVVLGEEVFGAQLEDGEGVLGGCLFWPDSFVGRCPARGS